jgi:periplasmic protein CpxP/Spy
MLTRLALVLGLGLIPLAAQPMDHPGPHQGRMLDRMADDLKLTESQKTQIQDIRSHHAEAAKAKVQAAREARKAFRNALRDPATTDAQLKPLYQTQSDRDFELMMDRRALRNEIRAILTPEQRIEMDKLQAYHQGMKRGRGMGF